MLWFPPPCFIPCGHLRRDPVWSSRSEPLEDNRFLQKKTLFSLLLKKYSIYPTHTHSYRLSTQTSASGTLEQMTFYTRHLRQIHSPCAFPNRQHTAQSNARWWSPVCPACDGSGILPVTATAVPQPQQQPQPTGEALMPSRAHLETKGQGVFACSLCCSALESDPTPMEPDLQAFQDQQENRPRYSIFQCSQNSLN